MWQLATSLLGAEPWDYGGYGGFYLVALGLSAVFGWIYPKRPWRWGLILILAQFPVMVFHVFFINGMANDGLVIVGLATMLAQTLPAIIVALAVSHFKQLRQQK